MSVTSAEARVWLDPLHVKKAIVSSARWCSIQNTHGERRGHCILGYIIALQMPVMLLVCCCAAISCQTGGTKIQA